MLTRWPAQRKVMEDGKVFPAHRRDFTSDRGSGLKRMAVKRAFKICKDLETLKKGRSASSNPKLSPDVSAASLKKQNKNKSLSMHSLVLLSSGLICFKLSRVRLN